MLVEFSVKNFRSIADVQTLSMVATTDSTLKETNCLETGVTAAPWLIRSAVLYGPNAAGKSNLIAALAFMRSIIQTSATLIGEGQQFAINPFRFGEKFKNQPTEFEVTFIEGGIRYQYGFSLTATRITHEWLFAYQSKKPQKWFERKYDTASGQDQWYLGTYFAGDAAQHSLWKKSTRANALFLSMAINFNCEQLKPIFYWFVNKLIVIPDEINNPAYTVNYIYKYPDEKNKIIQAQKAMNFPVVDILIEKQKGRQVQLQINQDKLPVQTIQEVEGLAVKFVYETELAHEQAIFDFPELSYGTQRAFILLGPLFKLLNDGGIFLADELDSSMHGMLAKFFIKLFYNKQLNKNNAQLIFSTHNTSLLDKDLFRRDQIWFIEKNNQQASHLYPLTDFSPRKDEALEKGYLMGRYGALPFLGEINF